MAMRRYAGKIITFFMGNTLPIVMWAKYLFDAIELTGHINTNDPNNGRKC